MAGKPVLGTYLTVRRLPLHIQIAALERASKHAGWGQRTSTSVQRNSFSNCIFLDSHNIPPLLGCHLFQSHFNSGLSSSKKLDQPSFVKVKEYAVREGVEVVQVGKLELI